jgi:hypothetical protein
MHSPTLCTTTPDPAEELLSARIEPRTSGSNLMKFCTGCRRHRIRRLQTWLRLVLKSCSFTRIRLSMSLFETVSTRTWTQVSGKKWRCCSWEMLLEDGEIECGPAREYSGRVSMICLPLLPARPSYACSMRCSEVWSGRWANLLRKYAFQRWCMYDL